MPARPMEGEGQPEHDTLRERGRSDPRVFRVLVTTNRAVLAGLFLVSVPAALLLGAFLHPTPFEYALIRRDPIQGLYQALVISTVTGATLVLTLSQLVLSEEFGPVGEQRKRMQETVRFRHDIERLVPNGSRPTPSGLLKAILASVMRHAENLEDAAGSVEDEQLAERIDRHLTQLRSDARLTMSMLEPSSFGTFHTVKAVFSFDLSAILHETGRIRSNMEPSLAPEVEPVLDDLENVLEVFGSARAHAKALYFQRELGDLSRWITYASFPAIVVAVASLLFFDPTAIDSGWVALTVASITVSIALTPFAILLAYIIRILKVSQATFSRSPFLIRQA